MKSIIKNIAFCGLALVGAGFGLSSCEDYLTVTPTDKIVEEDFWKDKNDLNNAVNGCYKSLVSNEMLGKYVYWGEERSDNFERSTSTAATGQVANIMNANLLPTYWQFNWTPVYYSINLCNKVLAHAPEVIENDESFSENDWKPIKAEMLTLRAFCHFLLLRTYGEIPYVTKDYNNDSEDLRLPQSTQLCVLDSIISDLESVKNDAMEDYGNRVLNKGRITKKALYALLADVYLWRASYKAGNNQPFTKIKLASFYQGEMTERQLANRHEEYSTTAESDYQKCVEYCNLIIDMRTKEYIKELNESGKNVGGGEVKVELEDLLEENRSLTSNKSAYTSLFTTGNSDESIFELQVDGDTYANSMITGIFMGLNKKAGEFTGAASAWESAESNPNISTSSYIFTRTDMRRFEDVVWTADQGSFLIGKYVNRQVSQSNTPSQYVTDNTKFTEANNNHPVYVVRTASTLDCNWIVYRMSEVYLMKAEAMSQLYSDSENLKTAFNYVREVFKRSNPYAYAPSNTVATDSLKFEGNFESQTEMEKLVLAERRREFVAEGKRWFDLVRFALRRGNTSEMVEILSRKYATNKKAIQSKLADMQSLYSPVYNNEIKNNNLLYQNGVWNVNESSSKTDNL